MHTMHPTLLIGPADWQPKRMPRAAFEARLAALWQAAPRAAGAIVYGDARDHAALAYLTNFTPKLEPGVALLRRDGAATLLVGGGVNMIPAAKPLTFIEHTLPLRGLGKRAADWAQELGRLLLIGGDGMPYGMRRELEQAIGPDVHLEDGTAALRRQMRTKSAHELDAVRHACAILKDALAALIAASGQGVTDALLAAEHAAHRRGAQDVRSLFGSHLQPFEVTDPSGVEQVYLAVRDAGYWAEGFVMLSDTPGRRSAHAALDAAIARVAPGVRKADIEAELARRVGALHPSSRPAVSSMGLALGEPAAPDEAFVAGEVVSIRVGAAAARISAMVAIGDNGAEVLWRAP